MLEWIYGGVNISIPGAGGADCINYLTLSRRFYETVLVTAVFSYLAVWSWPKLLLSSKSCVRQSRPSFLQILLFLHSFIFGIEIGFKLASQSIIWIFNPCHVLTMMQLFLLASQPCDAVTAVFRVQMHMLNGPLLALAFPVLNTRLLPFECFVYFTQHLLLLLIPIVILDMKSVFSVEPLDDLSWSVFALSLQVLYHFWILQPLSLLTGINLNHMLCPAVSDPFEGPHYRLAAMIHQPALILILGKCITCFSLTWFGQPLPWKHTLAIGNTLPQAKRPERSSDAAGLLESWLDTNSEQEPMSLGATSWCWSDLFRYQTYWFDWRAMTYSTATPNTAVSPETSRKSL